MDSCVFCDIAGGAAPAALVYQDDHVVAFLDIRPLARGHLLVVPRAHSDRLEDLDPVHAASMFQAGQRMARALSRSDLATDGANLVVNDGRAAFQTVFHMHLHVIPRWNGDRFRLGVGVLRRKHRHPESTAAAIRVGLDRLSKEENL
ncbi:MULTISPECIES: HIT domain-containing protein [unclassified Rhodococcus (in: high G+C Gram-positive bacteria)]|uniref:HIT family protein n=1 Tax=Rhodococcus sp. SJ-3 TaxID=3454628 RepID=UPI003F7921B2